MSLCCIYIVIMSLVEVCPTTMRSVSLRCIYIVIMSLVEVCQTTMRSMSLCCIYIVTMSLADVCPTTMRSVGLRCICIVIMSLAAGLSNHYEECGSGWLQCLCPHRCNDYSIRSSGIVSKCYPGILAVSHSLFLLFSETQKLSQ